MVEKQDGADIGRRDGSPSPFDRWRAICFGAAAARLAERGQWGRAVGLRGQSTVDVPLAEAIALPKSADLDAETVCTARGIGIVPG